MQLFLAEPRKNLTETNRTTETGTCMQPVQIDENHRRHPSWRRFRPQKTAFCFVPSRMTAAKRGVPRRRSCNQIPHAISSRNGTCCYYNDNNEGRRMPLTWYF
jgi:hypothetical protein